MKKEPRKGKSTRLNSVKTTSTINEGRDGRQRETVSLREGESNVEKVITENFGDPFPQEDEEVSHPAPKEQTSREIGNGQYVSPTKNVLSPF